MCTVKGKSVLKAGLALLACAAFMVFAVGCSTNAPLAPASGEPTNLKALNSVLDAFGADPFEGFSSADDLAKQVWYFYTDADVANVGQDGGTIYLELGGASSTFEIPEDAVCENGDSSCSVQITAEAVFLNTPYGPVIFYDFGPDGLVFNTECTLLLDSRLPEGTPLFLFWFNPDTGEWEIEQSSEADNNGVVQFEIHHFSKYAIS